MRAVSLHDDVIVLTSALMALNCTIVRGAAGEDAAIAAGERGGARHEAGAEAPGPADECFVIDSPVLPEELELLPELVAQAQFPLPSGLLATHGDWDHLLGRLAFPHLALGCAQSTAERLDAEPGVAQRALREFDEALYVQRARPLSLGQVQALPVPGRCGLGGRELELHSATGHTGEGMAVWVPWARILVAGDYLSALEIPTLGSGGTAAAYIETLERLAPLARSAEHVIPGHGPVIDAARALELLEEDLAYLRALEDAPAAAELPAGRRSREQRRLHRQNLALL